MVIFHTLAPGKAADCEAVTKNDLLPALRKAEVPDYWVSRTVFGGEGMERVTVRPMMKLGEIDDGPALNRVLGPEAAAKFRAKTADMYQSVQYRILRLRTDLSYMPAPVRVSQND